MKKIFRNMAIYLLAVMQLVSCATTQDAGPSYYLLSPEELTSQALDLKTFKLAIGPVDVPAHLDREGIASRDGNNQLSYSNNHRWAEPLKENLIKTIKANIAQLLPNQQLIDFPYRQTNKPDYQLSISIEKFGYSNDGSVVLKARSEILDAMGRQVDYSNIDLKRVLSEKDHAAIVRIMSMLLGEMTVQLATIFPDKL